MSYLFNPEVTGSVIIGCDSGNKLLKTPSRITLAGIQALSTKPAVGLPDEMDLLHINGQYYCVSSNRLKYERDKSINDNHLYLTLIAVAKEMRCRGISPNSSIVLGAGLPPGHMASKKLSNSYREYFLRNGGTYRFTCGGIAHQITIRDVIVCPQAYSILLTLPSDIVKKQSVYVTDIGGGTVDNVHLINGRPDPNMMSLDMGVIPMYNKIQIQMQNEHGRRISEEQIDDVILGHETYFQQEHIDLIFSVVDAHVKAIFDSIRESGADWKSGFVVFCGGGAILLRECISKYASKETGGFIVVSDICANAKGFEIFANTVLKMGSR